MTILPRRPSSSTSQKQHSSSSHPPLLSRRSSLNDGPSAPMSPSATATATMTTAGALPSFEPNTRLTTGTLDWRADGQEQRIDFDRESSTCLSEVENDERQGAPKISPQGRQDEQSISPFLTKHIPAQYAPLSHLDQASNKADKNNNTKYCYRHHPDLKCRRQANEPSMDQLQRELASLPQSDQEAISRVWSLFSAAPSTHRNMMLQGILAQCCFPQLSYISASVRDLIKIDFLSALPDEIGLRILCFLDPTSICKAAQVSERWRKLADDDQVWLKMCEQHIDRKCIKCGWGLPLLDRKRLRNEKRQMQLRQLGQHVHTHRLIHESLVADAGTGLVDISRPNLKRPALENLAATGAKRSRAPQMAEDSATPVSTRQPWKDVYRDRFRIGNNWKHGRCSTKVFRGHTNGVLCLQFDDNIIASGSYDSTIKLWDIEKGTEIRTLRGHTMGVRCLQFDDHVLASGSLDGSIRLWNRHTGQLLCHIPKADENSATQGHSGAVVGLHLEDSTIVSGSADKTVRVFDFKKKHCIVLRGHTDWVNAVHLDSHSRTVISASDDCTVKLWDLNTKSCIKTLIGHVGQVQAVVVLPPEFEPHESDADATEAALSEEGSPSFTYENSDSTRPLPPRYILTGSLDNNIRLWDVHTGRCLQTFFGHLEGIWGLAADTLRVVSGGNDCMVKIWDPRTGTCERTFYHHSGPVTCVGLSDRRLCTGSEDHEIRLYSFCADSKSSSVPSAG